jgi:hypothetical protein
MEDNLNLPIEAIKATGNFLIDANSFELVQRCAKMFASSQLIPKHYQGNVADCAIALMTAHRMQVDPMFFMQHSNVIHGKISIDGQLAIATLRRRYQKVAFNYLGQGDTRACECIAVDAEGNEFRNSIDVGLAKKMGWWEKNPLWRNLTDQMLAYRSAALLARLYCPDVMAGMPLEDEILDVDGVQVVRQSKAKNLQERLSASVNKPASSED